MQLNKNGKVCIECNKDLARFWGRNLCEKCLREALKEEFKEEDKRYAANRVNQTS